MAQGDGAQAETPGEKRPPVWADWHPLNPYQVREDAPNLLSRELADL